jgi:hypothetical protein
MKKLIVEELAGRIIKDINENPLREYNGSAVIMKQSRVVSDRDIQSISAVVIQLLSKKYPNIEKLMQVSLDMSGDNQIEFVTILATLGISIDMIEMFFGDVGRIVGEYIGSRCYSVHTVSQSQSA